MIRQIIFAIMIALSPLGLVGCRSSEPKTAELGLDIVPVTITSSNGEHVFKTEVARTDEEQQQGMMYRKDMADDTAMLFPFPQGKIASFWMKNTYVPLDIIFVKEDGTIANIGAQAVPLDENPVEATEPVTAVLEIKGGLSEKLGIKAGDKVHWTD